MHTSEVLAGCVGEGPARANRGNKVYEALAAARLRIQTIKCFDAIVESRALSVLEMVNAYLFGSNILGLLQFENVFLPINDIDSAIRLDLADVPRVQPTRKFSWLYVSAWHQAKRQALQQAKLQAKLLATQQTTQQTTQQATQQATLQAKQFGRFLRESNFAN